MALRWGSLRYGAARVLRNLGFAVALVPGALAAETVTVAALGDSLTQGYGLPAEDGLVPVLQEWLTENGADVDLLNAGVSGDTTAGGLARVEWTLTPEVDAMIVELGGNDMLRGLAPEVAEENLRGILDAAAAADVRVLLVGLEAPGNYGPDYKAEFEAIWPDLAAEFDATLYPDLFTALRAEGDVERARAAYFQPDGIHPNAEGVRRIVEDLGPAVLSFIEGQ